MPMIRIRLPLTAHIPGPQYRPMEYHPHTRQLIEGEYNVIEVPPNIPFEVEEAHGLVLVAKHGGEVIRGSEVLVEGHPAEFVVGVKQPEKLMASIGNAPKLPPLGEDKKK